MMGDFLPFLLFLCYVVSTINSESITYPSNHPVLIKCSNGENIHISKIGIYETETKCRRRNCNGTEIKEKITKRCDGKHSCSLIDDQSVECLHAYGYVDLSYSCYDRVLLCDFEISSCDFAVGNFYPRHHWSGLTNNWLHVQNHAYHWQRKRGNVQMKNNKDHTMPTGNGYYAFADASDGRPYHVAYLKSPLVTPYETQCLSFWYFIHNNHHQTFSVQQGHGRYGELLWKTSSRDTIGSWHHKELPLHSRTSKFHVYFRAERGNSDDGHISLDDISISNTICNGAAFYKETCLSVSKPIGPLKCPIRDIDFQTFQPNFEPEFAECSKIYRNLRVDLVNQCKDNNNSLCYLNIEEALHRRPECFMLNRIQVEYNCAAVTNTKGSRSVISNLPYLPAVTSTSGSQTETNNNTDFQEQENKFVYIVGGSTGSAVLVLCLVACIVYDLRRMQKKKETANQSKTTDAHYYNMNQISTLPDLYCELSSKIEQQHTYTEINNTYNARHHTYTEPDINNIQHIYTELGITG